MRRASLSVEPGKRIAAKMSGLAASLALFCASDYNFDPYAKALRGIGHEPFDVFNHTGDFLAGLGASMFVSYVLTGGQKVCSEVFGKPETASVTRMNRVSRAAGVLAAAAAAYAFEKFTGSPDMLDIPFAVGVGALASGLVQVERAQPKPEQVHALPATLPDPNSGEQPVRSPIPST